VVRVDKTSGNGAQDDAQVDLGPYVLQDLSPTAGARVRLGKFGLDELLGGGLVPASAILLGGEPGIGKSTLLLQIVGTLAEQGKQALYVSGEESLAQLRRRGERLGVLSADLLAMSTTCIQDLLRTLEESPPEVLVLDSVQTMSLNAAGSTFGTVSQVRAVATAVIERIKKTSTVLILVSHVTKEGRIAGPKLLEHMVDTVLYLEGDRQQLFRLLRVVKNRYGPADDLVVMSMHGSGLETVDDPSTFFLQTRDVQLSGTAVVMALDGQRPFAIEVQALVSNSCLSVPRRTALGFDTNRLHLLLAVVEKKLRIQLGQLDIYAKIGGGLRLQEPGLDLGIVAAILSSFYDRPLPAGAVFWGEIDLNGQVRPVMSQDKRWKQAQQLQYRPVFCPLQSGGIGSINALRSQLFGSRAED
jgi:DNA repair protein RadA/Sms